MNRTMGLGFLFFIALIVVGFGTLLVGDFHPFRDPVFIDVMFDKIPGLRAGDEVRVEGVLLGKVSELELRPHGVSVRLRLDKPIEMFSDYSIAAESTSVLGGTLVSIKRGSVPPVLSISHHFVGRTRPGLEEVGDLVSENRKDVEDLIANLKELTEGLKEGKGSIGKVFQSSELHDKLVAATDDARAAVTEVKKAGEDFQKKLDDPETPLGMILNDKEMGKDLKETFANAEATSASLKNIVAKIERGEGTLGKIVQEEEMYEKAKRTVDSIDKTFGRTARAVVEIVTETKTYNESGAVISKLGLRVRMSDDPDFTASQIEDKYFYFGAAFLSLDRDGEILFEKLVEDNESDTIIKPEVGLAYRVPWFLDRRLALRAGLIEGTPGVGVEFQWDDWGVFRHPVQFTAEIRDAYNDLEDDDIDEQIDGPLSRFYLKAPLWTGKDTWIQVLCSTVRVYAGVNRIGNDAETMFGIGFEWPDEDIRSLVGLVGAAR